MSLPKVSCTPHESIRLFIRIFLDFRRRFLTLLSYKFREFGSVTALSILEAANAGIKDSSEDQGILHFIYPLLPQILQLFVIAELKPEELAMLFTPFDLKRLESYANNMLDYHVILDLIPSVANVFFQQRLAASSHTGDPQDGPVRLSAVQSSILLAVGLQRKSIEDVEVRALP